MGCHNTIIFYPTDQLFFFLLFFLLLMVLIRILFSDLLYNVKKTYCQRKVQIYGIGLCMGHIYDIRDTPIAIHTGAAHAKFNEGTNFVIRSRKRTSHY